ncbi:MAG: DUF1573 domain-containing protein [Bacteroidia bacterium]
MKITSISLFITLLLAVPASAQTMFNVSNVISVEQEAAIAAITFDETNHNMGQIPQGIPVTHTFTFTNTGNAPLQIEEVNPSCGCTAADYTKDPIAPGETGYIKATFNAAGMGIFNKTIVVKTNSKEPNLIIRFSGEVVTR